METEKDLKQEHKLMMKNLYVILHLLSSGFKSFDDDDCRKQKLERIDEHDEHDYISLSLF